MAVILPRYVASGGADHQCFTGGFDDPTGDRPEIVDLEDAGYLGEEPFDEPEVARTLLRCAGVGQAEAADGPGRSDGEGEFDGRGRHAIQGRGLGRQFVVAAADSARRRAR